MDSKQKTSAYLFISLGLVAVVGLIVVAGDLFGKFSTKKSEIVVASGKEIAKKSFGFIEAFNADDASTLYSVKVCQGKGDCYFDQTNEVSPDAGRTWRMLANASMLKLSGEPRLKAAVDRDIEFIKKGNFRPNLHIAYLYLDVNQLYPNADLFSSGYFTARSVTTQLEKSWKDEDVKDSEDIMMMSAMTRLLSSMHRELKNSANEDIVVKDLKIADSLQELSYDANLFLKNAARLAELLPTVSSHTPQKLTSIAGYEYDLNTCWSIFGRAGVYTQNRDPQLLKRIQKDVVGLRLWDSTRENFSVSGTQALLACITGLAELRAEGPEFNEALTQLVSLFLLPGWDSPLAPECTGDGAFFTPLVSSLGCKGRYKYLSDSSWAVWVLSGLDQSFKLKV